MRQMCTGLLAAALILGLLAVEPAQAKVYKMPPEERAAALQDKKAKRAQAKKTGKAAPGQEQGGWVEVKPGEKIAKKNKKSRVDEIAQSAESKGKAKKSKKDGAAVSQKLEPKSKKGKKAPSDEIVVEKKGKKAKTEKKGKKSAASGDRAVGSSYGSDRKVAASSTEVRRTGAPAGDDLNAYSVSRPGQEKAPAAPVVPEVRQEVQPGPVDTAKPVSTEHKAGEGRF